VASCRADAAAAGLANAEFVVADVQTDPLGGPYDAVFSRFGTMFFNFPGAAMRNLWSALRPGGELTMVVWRKRDENPWLHAIELCVREIVPVVAAETSNQPTCGPGPFSMAGPDLVRSMLQGAGFEHVSFERFDTEVCIGLGLKEAIGFATDIGPAGEIMRLAGEQGVALRPRVEDALTKLFASLERDGAYYSEASVWIVNARRPVPA
jgi:SAM-dependent methyltransferase